MRTNYKRIKNILNNNWNDISIFKAKGPGIVLQFLELEETADDRVRIVLCDFNSNRSEIGIHIKLSKDIESDLLDAIETAFRDNYPAIYIHQKPKPSETRRLSRIKTVGSWLKKPRFELKHSLNKLFDVEGTLNSMSEDQLDLLLAFISGTYQSSHSESREHWAPKYHALVKALESKGVSHMECIKIADNVSNRAV